MPWHTSNLVCANGDIETADAKKLRNLGRQSCELITRNGKPYYFRERSELYEDWELDVEFQHDYTGLLMENPHSGVVQLGKEDQLKLGHLVVAYRNKTVRVEGFRPQGENLTL
jgi:hypothetical protein